jgi:PAS domain S-box-containing protein
MAPEGDRSTKRRALDALGYARVLDAVQEAVLVDDVQGRVVYANQAFLDLFGVERSELPDLTLEDYIAPEWRARLRDRHDRRMRGESVPDVFEYDGLNKGGERIHLQVHVTTLYEGEDPVGTQSAIRDMTERRRLEDELRHAQRLEAMGQLAGGVAHDFNNILAAILGSAEQLKRLAGGPEGATHARAIIAATRRGARLTRQLLTFGRKQVSHPINIDLRDRAVETAGWFARLLGDHVRLAIDPGGRPAVVEIDPASMEQIVLNLAVNARDAMPEGGTVTIRVSVLEDVTESPGTLDPLVPGDYVLLSVSDEGSGIDEDVLPHLFDPYFTTKPEGKGTGLGLASVYGIVREIGGSIRVTSEPGQGATFDVFLPRSRKTAADRETFVRRRVAHGSEAILLVEDDDAVRFALERTLAAAGYRVLAATDAADGQRIFAEHADEIDALVTDVHMPGGSGPDLAAHVRAARPDIPVLYLSGYVGDELRAHLEGAPVVEKPVSSAELTSSIRALLDE